jgi:2-polyprenyl-3-methyl-5-hydroxy-6-metoxy-1,4-benzoquinol methylase
MSKYDFELNMKTHNSNSVILKNIKPNSTVLEVGCAHGRMTKYLKETLNCNVDIIEIDEEAGATAKQWASRVWIGSEQGNVEGKIFDEGLFADGSICYDYIIFADVLEHLVHPEKVLSKSKNFLADEGSVWISIPNIAYNGVIIELLNDQFTYRETGLLDNTHLRFFTMYSLEKMVKGAGFKIVNEQNLINSIRNSEFKEVYMQAPPQIVALLRSRPSGEVYQMVWELKVNG